jgi:hypothetical protein
MINGTTKNFQEYIAGYTVESSIDQLLRCIQTGEQPESNAKIGAMGVEVLMAAYRSIVENGKMISLPLEEKLNPLFAD